MYRCGTSLVCTGLPHASSTRLDTLAVCGLRRRDLKYVAVKDIQVCRLTEPVWLGHGRPGFAAAYWRRIDEASPGTRHLSRWWSREGRHCALWCNLEPADLRPGCPLVDSAFAHQETLRESTTKWRAAGRHKEKGASKGHDL